MIAQGSAEAKNLRSDLEKIHADIHNISAHDTAIAYQLETFHRLFQHADKRVTELDRRLREQNDIWVARFEKNIGRTFSKMGELLVDKHEGQKRQRSETLSLPAPPECSMMAQQSVYSPTTKMYGDI